ncbi:MBL fold metallo-hydrolase [Paenibacillus sp. UNC451MF]|uniref:MBL fold metallo-hydrolase n=1 Tax=Paenibacillus sp. UNC451MF TaxID=1449063 RepID=UPI00048BA432|nr:MBL fold metallo-hydrolase [Paenibacillus sp. UNC451MF]
MSLYTTHNDTYIQVKVPLPFPLRWVNSYLIRGNDGYTLIDPGLHTEAAVQCWESVMLELKIDYRDIEQIVLTHHHPDHYGLAGWFQERSGAPVCISSVGYDQVRLLWGDGQPMTETLLSLFAGNGMPQEMLEPMKENLDTFIEMVSPQPEVTFISMGEPFRLGDMTYETVHTPGHALGHVCFYHADTKAMICGDHVLPQISPNVSYLPGIDENPLASFIQSLEHMLRYEVDWAYPGHREPFQTWTKRTEELIKHHEHRLEQMRSQLEVPLTAYQVCKATFGDRLSLHQLRFALSETLAHLIYLNQSERVLRSEKDGRILFQSK